MIRLLPSVLRTGGFDLTGDSAPFFGPARRRLGPPRRFGFDLRPCALHIPTRQRRLQLADCNAVDLLQVAIVDDADGPKVAADAESTTRGNLCKNHEAKGICFWRRVRTSQAGVHSSYDSSGSDPQSIV